MKTYIVNRIKGKNFIVARAFLERKQIAERGNGICSPEIFNVRTNAISIG